MTDLDTWCEAGRTQREATQGLDMVPMLVLYTDEGIKVCGLALEAEEWPEVFQDLRAQWQPTEAVLTVDAYLRVMSRDEVSAMPSDYRPSHDPAAGNAVVVTLVTPTTVLARHLPYAVTDSGTYTWLEPRDMVETYAPVVAALQAMVQ